MSRIFGAVFQNGYVVEDVDAAIEHWVNVLGVGPFYKTRSEFERYRYQGKESKPVLEIALASSGDLQIELIQQVNDEPSHWRDFLKEHGPGLQHVGVVSDDYDGDMTRHAERGCKILAEMKVKDSLRAAYLDTEAHPGTIVEVIENLPMFEQVVKLIRDASREWDGSDPVRSFSVGG